MFGEPKDVKGECNAHLYIWRNYGDNHATMRCQLLKGHKGKHIEKYKLVMVTWEIDERKAGSYEDKEAKGISDE